MAGRYITQVLLEFSEDDLTDTTPTWVDVTQDCLGIEWWAGIGKEGDDPEAGGAEIRLKSFNGNGRRWEPDYVAGQFYPNIAYGRRFRLTLDDAAGSASQQGLWYITDIAIEYPAGTGYSEVTITCADGFEVLALDDLPVLDPPDAQTYDEVVDFEEPWGFWTLGDEAGTRARANVIQGKRRVGTKKVYVIRKFKARRGTRYSTSAEAGSVAGPSGVYKGLPSLGQPGLVVGDLATCVHFDGTNDWVRIALEDDDLTKNNLTLEAIVSPDLSSDSGYIMAGPEGFLSGSNFWLRQNGTDWDFGFIDNGNNVHIVSGGTPSAGTPAHLAGTYDGNTLSLYEDGVLIAETAVSADVANPGGTNTLTIGSQDVGSNPFQGYIQKAAIYEAALSPERIAAHATAAFDRGYAQETAGNRIDHLVEHALWNESGIQTTGRDVIPVMQAGQSRIEELSETAHAEGVRTMFFFDGSGNPIYLGHEWQASSASYNTVQATLGDLGSEMRYDDLELVYDNETFNEVQASRVNGDLYTTGTGTPPPRRSHTEFTDVLLANQNELESLAEQTAAFYLEPTLRPVSVTLNGEHPSQLNHILRRDIGHLVRVKKSGDGGTQRIDRVANIIGKRKTLTKDRYLSCRWTLSRGFNAVANAGTSGYWEAGIAGFSEAGQSTVAA